MELAGPYYHVQRSATYSKPKPDESSTSLPTCFCNMHLSTIVQMYPSLPVFQPTSVLQVFQPKSLTHFCPMPMYHLVSPVTELFKMMQVVGPSVKLAVVIPTVMLQSLSLNYIHLFRLPLMSVYLCTYIYIYFK
jgi:hypothetical protein